MNVRSAELQGFIDAASIAFAAHASEPAARRAVDLVFAALESPGTIRASPADRPPVCAHFRPALETASAHAPLAPLVERLEALEPQLAWRTRPSDATASASFADGHANAMIVGPSGLEKRSDVWLGVSLLAPHVRYPDHDHAPEEVYLVLSDSDFRQADGAWFTPGIGGSFYNEPSIVHAMRSRDRPLLALWALRSVA
ncbi:MAG: transcriptional regulator [Rhizobiales bacterium]|nr:transcriptional regulator [Hyphomicrobiales bacterium]